MRIRRMIGFLTVGVLTFGLNAGLATSAQAVQPDPNTFYEIFTPDLTNSGGAHLCVDTNGSTVTGAHMIVFHCHSASTQEWKFIPTGDVTPLRGAPLYRIQNQASGWCLSSTDTLLQSEGAIEQESCVSPSTEWAFSDNDSDSTEKFNINSGIAPNRDCMRVGGVSSGSTTAANGSPLETAACDDPIDFAERFLLG